MGDDGPSAPDEPVGYRPQIAMNPPTACPTADSINRYLKSKDSPAAGYGQQFIDEGHRYNIDPRLPVAIMGAETSFGNAVTRGSNNLFNNLYNGANSPFDSISSAIHSEFKMLAGPNYAGRLGDTSQFYLNHYCAGSDCQNGLRNINKSLEEQGGNSNSLHDPCTPSEATKSAQG
jgi:hypothetical protein